MKKPSIETCWSIDCENFNELEFGNLIDDLRCNYQDSEIIGMTVYKAEAHRANGTDLIDVDDIMIMLNERAYDNYGECSEDWPGPLPAAAKKLEKYIKNWIKKEAPCNFWRVANVEKYVITEEDLE